MHVIEFTKPGEAPVGAALCSRGALGEGKAKSKPQKSQWDEVEEMHSETIDGVGERAIFYRAVVQRFEKEGLP